MAICVNDKGTAVVARGSAPSGGIKTTSEVSDEFIISRRNMGVRPRTLVQYESYLRIIKEEFGETPIADIERSGIEDWLSENDWSPRTRKNYLVTLTTLLNFAQDREYCPGNPASRIERPILDDNPPGILTVKEATDLLTTARDGIDKKFDPKPRMIPGIAIGLFAGLRRSEICSLDWTEIDLDQRYIEVKAVKAKTRQRRLVTISDNLCLWLKPFKDQQGRVSPSANQPVEVIVLSRNDPDSGRRFFESCKHYDLAISRGAFLCGKDPYPYVDAFNAALFLSANESDVRGAIDAGMPAGLVLPTN